MLKKDVVLIFLMNINPTFFNKKIIFLCMYFMNLFSKVIKNYYYFGGMRENTLNWYHEINNNEKIVFHNESELITPVLNYKIFLINLCFLLKN